MSINSMHNFDLWWFETNVGLVQRVATSATFEEYHM